MVREARNGWPRRSAISGSMTNSGWTSQGARSDHMHSRITDRITAPVPCGTSGLSVTHRHLMAKAILACALFLVFGQATIVNAADRLTLSWIGLFHADMLQWLENENRLADLCPESMPRERKAACRAASLAPKTWSFGLFAQPAANAPLVGHLVIVATPGQGLKAGVRGRRELEPAYFEPDLFDADWGYGPYFHQTVLQKRGPWVQLPARPLPVPVWFNTEDMPGGPVFHEVASGDIYRLGEKSWTVLEVKPDGLLVRPEQPADMWCEEGRPPALAPAATTVLKGKELFDAYGHLNLKVKYTRGC